VTRLGEFSPIGRWFYSDSNFENDRSSPMFLLLFSTEKAVYIHINFDKKWFGLNFGRFFSQTHVATLQEAHNFTCTKCCYQTRPTIFFGEGGSFCLFSDYSFRVHHHWDDRHLPSHAMASDFLVTWQCLSKRTIGFLLRIKLHAQETHTVCNLFMCSGKKGLL
jgi:hypothetical protein